VATLVTRNTNEAMAAPIVSLTESAFGGSLESCGRFCVGAFGRNLASVDLKMFSHFIYFVKKFYNFCASSAICKDNAHFRQH
jgi:hypothetical protein